MPVQTPMSLLFPPNPPPPLNGAVGLDQYSVSVAVSHIDTVGCVWVLLSDISVRTTDVYPSPVLGRQGSVDVLLIFFCGFFFNMSIMMVVLGKEMMRLTSGKRG